MGKRSFFLLKTLLVLVTITHSSVIAPRKQRNSEFENEHILRRSLLGKDEKLESSSGFRNSEGSSYDSSGIQYYPEGVRHLPRKPSDYDYTSPDENDESRPLIIPESEEDTIDIGDRPSNSDDEENFEPFDEDGKEGDKEPKSSPDEESGSNDKDKVPKESSDEGKDAPQADSDDDKGPSEEDGGKPTEELDEKDKEADDQNLGVKDSDYFFGGSILDIPFFNLYKVQAYFHQLERALNRVFHQTLDEARLLNGTYANTTEEEVDIGGKKYIVQKSVIKGRDNHSSLYVESLTRKRKLRSTKDIEVENDATK